MACGEIGPRTGTGNPTWEDARLYAHLGVFVWRTVWRSRKVVPRPWDVYVARRAVMSVVFVVVVVIVVRRFMLWC